MIHLNFLKGVEKGIAEKRKECLTSSRKFSMTSFSLCSHEMKHGTLSENLIHSIVLDSDAGRDWGREKETTEDEMAGWHH